MNAPNQHRNTVAWGIFCACSWTWCIGMFLPVLMLDRYGWTGFWGFLVPNVLGCSAMGYFLRTGGRHASMKPAHQTAGRWFSTVTVAYHLFFVVYLTTELAPRPYPVVAVAGGFLAGWGLSRLRQRLWLGFAAWTYAISIAVLITLLGQGTSLSAVEATRPLTDLIWLAPITAFGFSLCPYLDLTLRRAAAETPSPHAFLVFGLAFTVMLLLTCLLWVGRAGGIGPWAMVHLLLQSVFTIGAHLREIRQQPAHRGTQRWLVTTLPLLTGIVFLAVGIARPGGGWGLTTYLYFLACYGLVFPLYVLLFMGSAGRTMVNRPALIGYAIVVLVLAPCYDAGFNRDQAWLLVFPMVAFALWGTRRTYRLTTGAEWVNS